ncbi:hypothetical protein FRX31_026027, partial [Thalictrum thalictroides]
RQSVLMNGHGPWLDSVEVLSSLWATRPQDDDNSCQTTSDFQIGSTSSTTEPLIFQAIDQEKQTIRCIQAIELRKYRCMHGNLAMRSCTCKSMKCHLHWGI